VSVELTLYIQLNGHNYHTMLLRSIEDAKHGEAAPRQILWMIAEDVLLNPGLLADSRVGLEEERRRLLQMHDQKTAGPCGCVLASLC